MSNDTVRVRYLMAVEADGVRHAAGSYEADVSSDDAKALVAAGRVQICGEPLKLSDEERAALPALGQAGAHDEAAKGSSDQPVEHSA